MWAAATESCARTRGLTEITAAWFWGDLGPESGGRGCRQVLALVIFLASVQGE